MKIIERGEKPTWCKQYRCTGAGNSFDGCNSLLEVVIDDLVYYRGVDSSSPYGNGSEPAVSWRCPVCGEENDIPKEDWPKSFGPIFLECRRN